MKINVIQEDIDNGIKATYGATVCRTCVMAQAINRELGLLEKGQYADVGLSTVGIYNSNHVHVETFRISPEAVSLICQFDREPSKVKPTVVEIFPYAN